MTTNTKRSHEILNFCELKRNHSDNQYNWSEFYILSMGFDVFREHKHRVRPNQFFLEKSRQLIFLYFNEKFGAQPVEKFGIPKVEVWKLEWLWTQLWDICLCAGIAVTSSKMKLFQKFFFYLKDPYFKKNLSCSLLATSHLRQFEKWTKQTKLKFLLRNTSFGHHLSTA